MEILLFVGFVGMLVYYYWPTKMPLPIGQPPAEFGPTATLMRELDDLYPSHKDRDPLKHPMVDFYEKFPIELLTELHPAKQAALRSYMLWWLSETIRDTCERQKMGLQTVIDQSPEYMSDAGWRMAINGLIEANDSLLKVCEDNQNELGSPDERVFENNLPKAPR